MGGGLRNGGHPSACYCAVICGQRVPLRPSLAALVRRRPRLDSPAFPCALHPKHFFPPQMRSALVFCAIGQRRISASFGRAGACHRLSADLRRIVRRRIDNARRQTQEASRDSPPSSARAELADPRPVRRPSVVGSSAQPAVIVRQVVHHASFPTVMARSCTKQVSSAHNLAISSAFG